MSEWQIRARRDGPDAPAHLRGSSGMIQRMRVVLTADPLALRPARDMVRTWGTAVRLPQDRLDRLLLASGEALSNAIEHAYPPRSHRPNDLNPASYLDPAESSEPTDHRTVTLTLQGGLDRAVTAKVSDRGRWRDQQRQPDCPARPGTKRATAVRGRGLALIRSLMDHVDIRAGATGTTRHHDPAAPTVRPDTTTFAP